MCRARIFVLLLSAMHLWAFGTLTAAQLLNSFDGNLLLTDIRLAFGTATAAVNFSEQSNGAMQLTAGQLQYVPTVGICETNITTTVMQGEALAEELDWVETREALSKDAWIRYLEALNIEDAFDYVVNAKNLPRIAIAVSGGGYRAALVGAGVLKAFDERISSSVEAKSGGILQLAAYLLGLSGGAWTTASVADQDGVSIDEWVFNTTPDLDFPGLTPQEAISNDAVFLAQAKAKQSAGFNASFTDFWGRALCFAMMKDNDNCAGTTFSSLKARPVFQDYAYPLPIILAAARWAQDAPKNSSLPFEFTPFTSGTSTQELGGWIPTQLLGTTYDAGGIASMDACVTGFDNIGWITGASSNALDAFSSQSEQAWASAGLNVTGPYAFLVDTAGPMANPYKGLKGGDYDNIYFADGGLGVWGDLPLYPALITERQVDVLFVVDATADSVDYWPNGDALVTAAKYAQTQGVLFPAVPSLSDFQTSPSLLQNITFFGCGSSGVPKVVYIPNRPVTFSSNTSTFQNEYSVDEKNGMIGNGWAMVTEGDAPLCIGCLLVSGTGYSSAQCDACMERRCWQPISQPSIAVSGR